MDEQRTEHKGILPAQQRIKQYKVRTIKRNIPSALPPKTTMAPRLLGVQSTLNLAKGVMGKDLRPTTAAIGSTYGMSEM